MTAALSALRAGAPRAWNEFLYVSSSLLLGFTWSILLGVLLAVGIGTAVVTVGIPILAVTLLLWRWGADTERARAALVLEAPIPRPARRVAVSGRLIDRWKARLSDRATWRDLGHMLLLGPVGVVGGALALGAWSLAVALLGAPIFASQAPGDSLLGGLGAIALVGTGLAGLAIVPVAISLTAVVSRAEAGLASELLAPSARAELAARVSALEASRAGAVESADARLRRIERDLHDGAQHRLAYIAMELDRAREKLAADPDAADALLAGAHEESKRAMVELRDLVRGIHPSVLAERGLDAALSGLAERCPVPVAVDVRLPARLPAAIETAAYYVVAEALTNVGRHARASAASVRAWRAGGRLVVEVGDDGRGEARRAPGSGLEGLAQRVEALDGRLEIESPPGGPTRIRAELPCA